MSAMCMPCEEDWNLDQLDDDAHGALAVAVGEVTTVARQQDEGHVHAEGHDALPAGAEPAAPDGVHHTEDEDGLEEVVIGGAEELRHQQRGESTVK